MTREEALEQLMKKPYDQDNIRHEFEYIAKKLGITVDELQSYFDLPNNSFKNYKNQGDIYNFGAWAMRLAGLELGGKR